MPASLLEALLIPLVLFVSSGTIGVAGLLSRRTDRPAWILGFGLPALIVIGTGAGAGALRSWLLFCAGALPAFLGLMLFACRRWHEPFLRVCAKLIRWRLLHAGGFLLLGPAMAALWAHYYDVANMAPEVIDLGLQIDDREFVGQLFESTTPSFLVETDFGQAVPIYAPPVDPTIAPELRKREDQILSTSHRTVIRTGPIDLRYNCIGWVFADGQGWLKDPSQILIDNGYQMVSRAAVGDVIVYRKEGKINHVGVVRLIDGKRVIVESKWGPYGRFLHLAEDQPFSSEYAYYHTTRGNHWLRRIQSPTN